MSEIKEVKVDLNGSIVAAKLMGKSKSGKAILVDFYGVEEWIPTSLCEINDDEIIVEDWKAEQIQEKLGEVY